MANGNPRRYSSTLEPHATISAQDLVHGQPERCGFLRKRGKKERMLENLHLSRHINWRQRFVVIQDGCCYCFADEVSRGPLQTFSLQGYNKVYRSRSDRAAFVFRLEPACASEKKIHTFAATTDQDRLAWMRTFRQAMAKANEVKATDERSTVTDVEDMYIDVEKTVFQPAFPRRPASDPQASPDEDEEEDSGDDSDNYDRLDELVEPTREKQQRRHLPLPPLPQNHAGEGDVTSHSTDSLSRRPMPAPPGPSGESVAQRTKPPDPRLRPAAPLPASAHKTTPSTSSSVSSSSSPTSPSCPDLPSRPKASAPEGSGLRSGRPPLSPPGSKPLPAQKPGRRLSERDSLFDNSDREAAIEILRECKAPGTFLIRKSRQGDSKVLVVMTSEDVKEYKIFTENHEVSLDRKTFFNTVDDLLDHYNHSPLPNRQQTLRRSYSTASNIKH